MEGEERGEEGRGDEGKGRKGRLCVREGTGDTLGKSFTPTPLYLGHQTVLIAVCKLGR